jgi:hypothetical protein
VDVGIDNVDSVGIGEGGIGAFPGCYSTSAGAQGDGGGFNPSGAKTIEEVGLSGYLAVLYVCVSELANINLEIIRPREIAIGQNSLTVSW